MKSIVIAATLLPFLLVSCAGQKSRDNVSRNAPVLIGEHAPDFTLEDQSNRKVALSAGLGKMPTVLVFYRGSW